MEITNRSGEGNVSDESHRLDASPDVRRLARELALVSHAPTADALDRPKVEIARLTAGLNPNKVDKTAADYRFGAVEALSTMLNGIAEQMLSTSTLSMLRKGPRARILAGIAAHRGATQKSLAETLSVKESNLSSYVRDLANAGVIEPTIAHSGPRGKAWALTPWGVEAFFAVANGDMAELVPPEELSAGLHGALRQRPTGGSGGSVMIQKDDFYNRLELALDHKTSVPLWLSTLFPGDLREHERPWKLHQRVFKDGAVARPVNWLLLDDAKTGSWVSELIADAHGKSQVSVWSVEHLRDPTPTIQVLDYEGLVYPLLPNDCGLVQDRETAMEAWKQISTYARLRVHEGAGDPGAGAVVEAQAAVDRALTELCH